MNEKLLLEVLLNILIYKNKTEMKKLIITILLIVLFSIISFGQSITDSFTSVESTAISNGDTLTNNWQIEFSYLIYGDILITSEDNSTTNHKILETILLNNYSSMIITSNGIFEISKDFVEYRWTFTHNGSNVQMINRYKR